MSDYASLALYIDGEWISGGGRASEPVIDPATEETLGHLPHATAADLDRALAAAARAFPEWRARTAIERRRILTRAADLIQERRERIARILTLEQGKPIAEARSEVTRAAEHIEFMAHEAMRLHGRIVPPRQRGMRQTVVHEPIGVVAAFAPWNFPAIAPGRKLGGALAAGCCCILKASEETPGTAIEIVRALHDAGVPPGVMALVFGNPPEISRHLIASPVTRKVTFTGSIPVGKSIAAQAAQGVKPVTLELGGHAPVLIYDDVDVGHVSALAVAAKFRNAGQICVAPTRFLVHENIYADFVDRFVEATEKLVLGSGLDAASTMGPLANARRMASMEKVTGDAVTKGAVLRTGGRRHGNTGYFWRPTVLSDVPETAAILSEEPFGPVAVFRSFRDDGVIGEANGLPYGLAAYLFTADADRQARVSAALEAGLVGINTFTITEPETPWGGVKESGYGRVGGSEGLEAFTVVKYMSQAVG